MKDVGTLGLVTCPLSSLVLLHILSRAWSKDPPGVAFFFPVACEDRENNISR